MNDLDLRPIRRFLNLTLGDVFRATGVPAQRLSLWERGLTDLKPLEYEVVVRFLKSRAAGYAVREVEVPQLGGGE